MFSQDLQAFAAEILDVCRDKGIMLATAESCTGGLISALFTEIPGSSDVFDCGFVTYSYDAKTAMLGVDKHLLQTHGAVEEQVVAVMAQNAIINSRADIAVAVSGIAGPDGAVKGKPVGTVFIGVATKDDATIVERYQFEGDRTQVRMHALQQALEMLATVLTTRSFVSLA